MYVYILIKSIDISKPLMDIFHFTPQVHFSSFIAILVPWVAIHMDCAKISFPSILPMGFASRRHWQEIWRAGGKSGRNIYSSPSLWCFSAKGHTPLRWPSPPQLTFLVPLTTSSPIWSGWGCQVMMDPCSALWSFSLNSAHIFANNYFMISP